ncbi:MAG: hypothetical protein IRZ07_00700 [Microbispora sp.]|nr:hypothetical protein [Microbispora sp.]
MIPADTKVRPLLHYAADSATAEWLAAMREMETEGATTPAQRTYHVPASMAAELLSEVAP